MERLSSVWRHTNQSLLVIHTLQVTKIQRLLGLHHLIAIEDYLLCAWKLLSTIYLHRQISLILEIHLCGQTYLLRLILRDIIQLVQVVAQLLCSIDVLGNVWLITHRQVLLSNKNIWDSHLLISVSSDLNSCNRPYRLLLETQIGKLVLGHLIDHLDLWDRCWVLINAAIYRQFLSLNSDSLWLLLLTTEFLDMIQFIFATNNSKLLSFAHTLIEYLDFLLQFVKVEILGLLLHFLKRIDQLLKLLDIEMIQVIQLLLIGVQKLVFEYEEDWLD